MTQERENEDLEMINDDYLDDSLEFGGIAYCDECGSYMIDDTERGVGTCYDCQLEIYHGVKKNDK